MNTVNSLLFLVFVSLWRQAVFQNALYLTVPRPPTEPETSKSWGLIYREGIAEKVCISLNMTTATTPSEVRFKTKDGSAKAPGDYTAMDKNLTFTDDGMQCAWIYVNLDVEKEDSEWFTLEVTAFGLYENFSHHSNYSINDGVGIQRPSFSIEHSDYAAIESDGEMKVCVAYYGPQPLASDATVQLSTNDYTHHFPSQAPSASRGSDYVPMSENFTFSAGCESGTSMCITITIVSDGNAEGEENFQVELTTQSDVTLDPFTSATVHIIDFGTIVPDNVSIEGTCPMKDGVSLPHSSLSMVSLLILGFFAFTVLNGQ